MFRVPGARCRSVFQTSVSRLLSPIFCLLSPVPIAIGIGLLTSTYLAIKAASAME